MEQFQNMFLSLNGVQVLFTTTFLVRVKEDDKEDQKENINDEQFILSDYVGL